MTAVDKSLSEFYLIGINYKKTDAEVRGQYAINNDQYLNVLQLARQHNVAEVFIVSTCNRTEIYGLHQDPDVLTKILCSETAGDINTFQALAYVKNGLDAVEHLFNVTSGLDSQVLGDYEIIGQVKTAAKLSKKHGLVGPFLERLVNTALAASKAIKTNTQLSDGTVSVSFAAVQYIKDFVADYSSKKILLIGTGKIGRNTCKNLVDYLQNKNVTLVNRTVEKAHQLATELGLKYASMDDMDRLIEESDIVITSTSSKSAIIGKQHLEGHGAKLIIDLSVPNNVDTDVRNLPYVTLMNVDELSAHKDTTLEKRKAEVPKAKAIIAEQIADFTEWLETRKYVPVLVSLKATLQQMDTSTLATTTDNNPQRIQKIINATALKLKSQNTKGCHYIAAINEFFG
ncbi:glutamyl-tRNA reductase [Polluticoccus soli]|uniref:glutamyl-tRNA reductase n=1 Tax=Polluticoccus soli TaxID=3034150 RepID=UPI0023E0B0F4|nr:glutamyl-tRNA reductase [Flavipsychrobacter sp. JY13-12]